MKGIRPEIIHFARLMEERMQANDHKSGWRDLAVTHAWERFQQEGNELCVTVYNNTGSDRIASEAADCANFLMMLVIAAKREGAASQ